VVCDGALRSTPPLSVKYSYWVSIWVSTAGAAFVCCHPVQQRRGLLHRSSVRQTATAGLQAAQGGHHRRVCRLRQPLPYEQDVHTRLVANLVSAHKVPFAVLSSPAFRELQDYYLGSAGSTPKSGLVVFLAKIRTKFLSQRF
jgi:hypothetical protein